MNSQLSAELKTDESLELDALLGRVEQAATHYDVLGVAREAKVEQVKRAYRDAAALIQSASRLSHRDVLEKLDLSFDKVSQAFSVLANTARRAQYDQFLSQKAGRPSPLEMKDLDQEAESAPKGLALYKGFTEDMDEDNRRRNERIKLAIPARATGFDRKSGRWIEETETHDVSNTGLTLKLHRRVRHGAVIHLCLPMPMHLRSGKQKSPDYTVYGLVRRVEPAKKGSRIVALEFIGENPPRGYLEKPWALFRSAQWGGAERRRTRREQRRDAVWLEYFSESMQCIRQEAALTEDVSSSGMRVFVKAAPIEFELVRVSYPNKDFESFAVMVNRFVGQDKLERLCLRFVDLLDPFVVEHKPEHHYEPVAEIIAEPDFVAEPLQTTEPAVEPVARIRKILVADDDPPLRKVMGKILTQAGYDVILAEDGKMAVEKAAAEKPDLVITDGLMPKLHGFLVCKAVKEMDPPPKVILVTAVYTKMNYKWEVRDKYGADALITKPFEVADLLACIKKQLADSPRA